MNVLSLFDGMSCGRLALERAGVPVTRYWASEIDEVAKRLVRVRYPDSVQLGDIENWRRWNIDFGNVDLILAGSPCQGLSRAGSGAGFEDSRSALFWVFNDILAYVRSVNPAVRVLFENVRMTSADHEAVDAALGIRGRRINSALVSGMLRDRYYWTDIDSVALPQDRGIVLQDVIEPGWWSDRDKAYTLTPSFRGMSLHRYLYKGAGQVVFADGWDPRPMVTQENVQRFARAHYELWRDLLPVECERLQTVPEGYTAGLSRTARHRLLGNGWTVDVIAHLLAPLAPAP